jgi:hypothetical protein
MEPIKPACSCLDHLTPIQKQKADAIAGGNFSKLLIELQIIRSSFSSSEKPDTKKSGLSEYKRPDNIMKVFYSEELQIRQPGSSPYFLEKKFPFLGPSVIKTMI